MDYLADDLQGEVIAAEAGTDYEDVHSRKEGEDGGGEVRCIGGLDAVREGGGAVEEGVDH